MTHKNTNLQYCKSSHGFPAIRRWLPLTLLFFLVAGCGDKEQPINVGAEQLYGCWVKNGTQEYWRYLEDGTGVTWDESEDISEDESNLRFEWSVSGDLLTHIFHGEQDNQAVPKLFTIKGISASSMSWVDDYGQSYTFIKVLR